MLIKLPDEIDFFSFFSCDPNRDEYDELTLSYGITDENCNRLEFSFNEATRTVCTTVFKGNQVLENVFVEGLVRIYFLDKGERKCLIAECKKADYLFKLELYVEPCIQINWSGQEAS
ncbi:hypothetical protein [Candidatus Neptunichlamydia sp. REUL1]|uniref:hypothetical protein n=1 Tax=Candidatus Neptunichlamydia sp. REUL1 TaxID=3064277 RepID=UPI00292FB82B|nr:hypothetical protein [Candidatus Neptunochlamydia sp. REUL1]